MSIFPTVEEAKRLGGMASDNEMIINQQEIEEYRKFGFETFFRDRFQKGKARQWYQGMDVIVDGLKYYRESAMHVKIKDDYLYALYAKHVSKKFKRFSVIGTPDELRKIKWAFSLLDDWSQVEDLYTTDESFLGKKLFGKVLCSFPPKKKEDTVYMLLSRDKTIIKEIRKILNNTSCEVIDFYNLNFQ